MSDFAEDQQEVDAGPSKPSTTTNQPVEYVSRRKLILPPSTSIRTLTEPKEAPLWLRLAYKACIPCRKAVSRCDGHEYYTQACSQCRSKGIECSWALSRHEKTAAAGNEAESDHLAFDYDIDGTPSTSNLHAVKSKKSRNVAGEVSDSQYTSDGLAQSEGDEARDGSRGRPHKRVRKQFRFPQNEIVKKGHLKHKPIPSAGWNTVGIATKSRTTKDVKGKGKAHALDGLAETETRASTNTDEEEAIDGIESHEKEESESTAEYDAILAQLTSTQRGVDFLETSSYTALLRSIFAEESSNLARSLYWWEFLEPAKKHRARWPSLPIMDKKKWKKLSFLEMLLAENTYMWTLWPRPPREESSSIFKDTIYPPASLDDNRFISTLPEAIVSTSLDLLHKSSLPDEIIKSMTPMHIRAWTQSKRDHGFPATIQTKQQWRRQTVFGSSRSKYAIPPSSTEDFATRHLNRDELVLDIIEARGSKTAAIVQHAVDSVLLKVAAFRQPKGVRRPHKMRWSKEEKGNKDSLMSSANQQIVIDGQGVSSGKGKGKGKDTSDRDKVSSLKGKGKGKATDFDASIVQEEAGENEAHAKESNEDRTQRKSKAHQPPADWQKVLLAAISVPGLPRSAIVASVQRLQALYGPSEVDFISRWDALYAPVQLPQSVQSSLETAKIPPPSIIRSKRQAYLEDFEARQEAKRQKVLTDRRSIRPELWQGFNLTLAQEHITGNDTQIDPSLLQH